MKPSVSAEHIAVLEAALNKLRRPHETCEDSWYSCPKAPSSSPGALPGEWDSCRDDADHDQCECGADWTNAIIDAALGVA